MIRVIVTAMYLNRLKIYLSTTSKILQSLIHSTTPSDYQERTVCLAHYMTMNKCFMIHYKSVSMSGLKRPQGLVFPNSYSGIWLGSVYSHLFIAEHKCAL